VAEAVTPAAVAAIQAAEAAEAITKPEELT
jgi:hypothetical protein